MDNLPANYHSLALQMQEAIARVLNDNEELKALAKSAEQQGAVFVLDFQLGVYATAGAQPKQQDDFTRFMQRLM